MHLYKSASTIQLDSLTCLCLFQGIIFWIIGGLCYMKYCVLQAIVYELCQLKNIYFLNKFFFSFLSDGLFLQRQCGWLQRRDGKDINNVSSFLTEQKQTKFITVSTGSIFGMIIPLSCYLLMYKKNKSLK